MGHRDRRPGARTGDRVTRFSHRRKRAAGPVVVAIPEDMLIERIAVPTRRCLR